MYKEILVPLDGSRFAEYALPTALSIAERTSARIRLVSAVTDVPPLPIGQGEGTAVKGWFDEARSRASAYLEAAAERLLEEGLDTAPETEVLIGPAVRKLVEEIERRSPDLVVMTTHGRGPLERAWVGSVTDGLLRRASSPLLLVRPVKGEEADLSERPSFRRILIPLDASETAESVLEAASELARLSDASLDLVTVVPPLFPVGSVYLPHLVEETEEKEERKESFESYLGEVRDRLSGNGFEVRTQVREADDAASGILDAARSEGIDLVAMSTHGRSGVARFVLGSVADKVIRGTTLPVFVVRAPES